MYAPPVYSWRIYRVNVQTPAKRNLVKGCKRITFVKHTDCIIQDGDNTWWLTNDRPYLSGNLRGQKNTPLRYYVHRLLSVGYAARYGYLRVQHL